MAEIDLETVEKLMKLEAEGVLDPNKNPIEELEASAEESYNKSRKRSGSRDRRKDDRSRSRSRGRRRRSTSEDRERQRQERVAREQERRRLEEEERRRQAADDARRDDLTVLVLNLNLKADERDIYEFFSQAAGKVRDIQIVRDQRSGRSKGVAYVEFYTQEAVLKALSCTGQQVKGTHIRVQASQAEKNRARVAAKEQERALQEASLKLYVGGLSGPLSKITDREVEDLFEPFGFVEKVEVPRDPYTKKTRGFAFVQMAKAADAQAAMQGLNGFKIGEQEINVGLATDPSSAALQHVLSMQGTQPVHTYASFHLQGAIPYETAQAMQEYGPDIERLDDDGSGGMIKGANAKIALMQKLQREAISPPMPPPGPPPPNAPMGMPPPPTCNILLRNMFDPQTVRIQEAPSFFNEIEDDVESECSGYGKVKTVLVDRNTASGEVCVQFYDPNSATKALQSLNGRWFGGKQIIASYCSDNELANRMMSNSYPAPS